MDLFLQRYAGQISYLWLGNEVNLHLSERENEQRDYASFFNQMYRVAKEAHPELQIGLIVTFPYEEEPIIYDLIQGAEEADLIGYTYYPQWLSMRPEDAEAALDRIHALNMELGTRYAIVETAWSSQEFGGSEEAHLRQSLPGVPQEHPQKLSGIHLLLGFVRPQADFLAKSGVHVQQ